MKVKIGKPKENQKVSIQIHDYDVEAMDYTLALIIAPMLRKFKAARDCSPFVEDEDVPEAIRTTAAKVSKKEYEEDEFLHDRWDWVLDEMIAAFEAIAEDQESTKEREMRVDRGLRYFGKYYRSLWN